MSHETLQPKRTYYKAHYNEIMRLLELADRSGAFPTDPNNPMLLHDYIKERWMQGDHWDPNGEWRDTVAESDKAEFMGIVNQLNLLGEVIPPSGTEVDEVCVVGSTFSANFRRTYMAKKLIDEGIISFKGDPLLSVWAGKRPSFSSEEVDFHGFLGEKYKDVKDVFEDETEMALFVLTTLWGRVENGRLALPEPQKLYLPEPASGHSSQESLLTDHRLDGKPPLSESIGLEPRDYALFEYAMHTGETIRLLNARPVVRRQGDPRHTTESSLEEWLALSGDLRPGYTILEINGNPHSYRINAEIKKVLGRLGRGDINVISGAISARHDSPPSLFLGEIGRILYNNY